MNENWNSEKTKQTKKNAADTGEEKLYDDDAD